MVKFKLPDKGVMSRKVCNVRGTPVIQIGKSLFERIGVDEETDILIEWDKEKIIITKASELRFPHAKAQGVKDEI